MRFEKDEVFQAHLNIPLSLFSLIPKTRAIFLKENLGMNRCPLIFLAASLLHCSIRQLKAKHNRKD